MKDSFSISVVVPVCCEEGSLKELNERILKVIERYDKYEIIYVDDGSSDNSLGVLKELSGSNQFIHYLSFSRNFGHQPALKAGLDKSRGDCVVSLDSDLQHPPELIPDMVNRWLEGYEIIQTKRKVDPNLSFFKRFTSKVFYKLLNKISSLDLEEGAADFRLLDKKVVHALKGFPEYDLFYRGLISWLGFKSTSIEYQPDKRRFGETKYTIKRMLKFSLSGITSFSTRPLHLSTMLGFTISGFCVLYGIYVLYIKAFTDDSISGWASIVMSILFIGGVQLIVLGLIGEYLGKLFVQMKGRPHYIIREKSDGI